MNRLLPMWLRPLSSRRKDLRRPSRLRLEELEQRETPVAAVGLTATGTQLVTFDTVTPGTVSAPVSFTGLQSGETLLGIDYRPLTGVLYGLGSTSRLYTINPTTGAATQVGSGTFAVPLSGTNFGFDFN